MDSTNEIYISASNGDIGYYVKTNDEFIGMLCDLFHDHDFTIGQSSKLKWLIQTDVDHPQFTPDGHAFEIDSLKTYDQFVKLNF